MDNILNFSNPKIVLKKAKKIYGKSTIIFLSDKPKKKYMILNPYTNKFVYFGQMGYQDFTFHKNETRRKNYLSRTANMRGNWKNDPYSSNNLSRNLLW